MKPTIENLVNAMIGKSVKADHPITCLNPDPVFTVAFAKVEFSGSSGKDEAYYRGENTMWFHANMLEIV